MFTGILLKTLSTLAFTAMALGVRAAAQNNVPVAEIVFFRSLIALLILFVWLAASRALSGALATKRPLGHLGRGLSGVAGMFSNFSALALLPLADATAYFYAYPIFVTVIAGVFLRERLHVSRWLAVLLGFGGVLVMLSEHLGAVGGSDARFGAGVALFGALCAALSIVQTRRLAQVETTGAIVFYFTCLCTLFGGSVLALAPFVPALGAQAWVTPDQSAWMGVVVAGAAGGVAQILATSSYRHADASLLAAFDYLAMVWALLASFAFDGEFPSVPVLVGVAAISSAGLLALSERRFQRSQKFVISNEIV
ncbi:EamA family transporter [Rhodoblastus acidophilus]|uniref:EamA family transporter n=1 Tax=Rhodoblastus acidophilus TaxID=1074 RepID=A0A6N8DP00_RHOAC|nr:DMT family transporter [Rhodoblastus acidophilus]MCW2273935.1 drug/metabolite transporter (DMT)-like permease [Rhodoblastus acidophilus]MTV30923.1 EamA family transporter [Rhodoblastus acidophilus]